MKKIESEIIIQSTIEKVWKTLTDFDKQSKWNPFIRSIFGKKEVGKRIKVTLQVPDGNKMTFQPKILVFDKEKELRWKGQLFIPGLFDGEHYFILNKINKNTTKFIHGEIFTGILTGVFKKTLFKTQQGFEMMNKSLKQRCEESK